MTFESRLAELPMTELTEHARRADDAAVSRALARCGDGRGDLADVAALLSPAASDRLEELGRAARRITRQRFGRTVHLFAPLYLSNECLSTCTYCGFSKHLDIRRRTLTPVEVERESAHLSAQGFRHQLLVSAEHQKHVSPEYLELVLERLHPTVPSLTIETQVWDTDVYRRLGAAGCEGVVIYQETYLPDTYQDVHLRGMKRHYDFRLAGPERVAAAGLRRVGIGALFGLHHDWREEALALAAHADWLTRTYWDLEVTVAFPRMRDSAAGFRPRSLLSDRELVQLTAAMRLFQHDVGIVLSTRESPTLRDGIVPFGVTHMSAGSSTEPGGYEEAGTSEEQFAISDERSPAQVASMLRDRGYDPVWKDWSGALSGDALERL
ncbi:MAG: 2-iminoacetate synthase ThiH [Nitriliruptorales bacterium]|nr:2-iminoacetate synthase ThiH [Nitriliruptorales bacterium]